MMSLTGAGGLAILTMVLGFGGPALAQESLEAGKSGAQLYAANCAMCHKSPQAVNKGALFGLSGFLRQHYTASRESASAIAAYVEAQGRPVAGPPSKRPPAKRTAAKPGDAKPGDAKPKETKPAQVEAKPAEAKPAEAKPAEPKSDVMPILKPEESKKPD
jgi:hypothetical protein